MKFKQRKYWAWGALILPVFSALLLAALDRQQAAAGGDWLGFLGLLIQSLMAGLPLFAVHILASRTSRFSAITIWIAGFVLYPWAMIYLALGNFPLTERHCTIAAIFSAISLLSGLGGRGRILSIVRRSPITLDNAVFALLALWTLAATSLFASTPDAVNNQPLRIWFDADRFVSNPLEVLSYLLQFTIVAGLLWGFYWINRYVLIRRILHKEGWIALAFASLATWIVYTPLAGQLILFLQLNPPHWSLLPSENHNPFDPTNYGFTFILWATITPIILASERLLAERSEAMGRHAQVRAELQVLQQQINPHFLFNSLNTVYALCLKDSAASAEAVVKLSDLLRYAVYDGQKEWGRLDEEIAYLRNYIDLQLLRFGSRCQVTCNWPGDASQYSLPPLLLIMLVENAFKHGVEPLDDTSVVEINLSITNARMLFTCINVPTTTQAHENSSGLGLHNLRRRLELIFGDDFVLWSGRGDDGWRAELELELRQC
jgi:hypothetical protein